MELLFLALIITATVIKELRQGLNTGDGGDASGRL